LISSSNFDCSQVRVPSAKTKVSRRRTGKITDNRRKRIKLKYLFKNVERRIQVITTRPQNRHSCRADTPVRLFSTMGDFCYLLEFKINVKCSGQECPLYTDYLMVMVSTWAPATT